MEFLLKKWPHFVFQKQFVFENYRFKMNNSAESRNAFTKIEFYVHVRKKK